MSKVSTTQGLVKFVCTVALLLGAVAAAQSARAGAIDYVDLQADWANYNPDRALAPGEKLQFNARAYDMYGCFTPATFVWVTETYSTSGYTATATNYVSSTGLFTAPNASNDFYIHCTYSGNPEPAWYSGTHQRFKVRVTVAGSQPRVGDMRLNETYLLKTGQVWDFGPSQITDVDGNVVAESALTITWWASKGTINSQGVYTAPTKSANGVYIKVTCGNYTRNSLTFNVSGQAAALSSITIGRSDSQWRDFDHPSSNMMRYFTFPGQTVQFSALGYNQYGQAMSAGSVKWELIPLVQGPSAGTLSASGLYTAPATNPSPGDDFYTPQGTRPADYQVKLTCLSNTTLTVSQAYYIDDRKPTYLTISPENASVAPGANYQFTARPCDQQNMLMTVDPYSLNWTASNGMISSAGLFTAPFSTCSAWVKLTCGSLKAWSRVGVGRAAPDAASITVSPAYSEVMEYIGTNPVFSVWAYDQFGDTIPAELVSMTQIDANYRWTQPTGGGDQEQYKHAWFPVASCRGVKKTVVVDYKEPQYNASYTRPSPMTATVKVGQSLQLAGTFYGDNGMALAYDRFGNAYPTNNAVFTWSASGGTVTAGGLYTAPATAGTYTVRCAYPGLMSFTATITVTN